MSDASGKVATYGLKLDSNAGDVSGEAAEKLEVLRAALQKSQENLKGYGAALKSLRGSSDEVAAAKEELKTKIDAERGAISQANLAILKQGQTYEQLSAAMRKAEAEQKKLDAKRQADEAKKQAEALKEEAAKMRELAEASKKSAEAFKAQAGPLGELVGKLGDLRKVGEEGNLGMLALGGGIGLATAAVVGLAAATVDGAAKMTSWSLSSANALRSMGLMREAVLGTEKGAQALGSQVDALSSKLATPKEKLNELATSLTKTLSGGISRASPEQMGRAIVDTFGAVAAASDAMGEQTGKQIEDIITRGKVLGRMRLNPWDLEGTQVRFEEVSKALASNMKVGVKEAQQALLEGRVAIDDGAKAMKDAVNARFGEVNAKKMLDLGVIADKLGEKWRALTKDIPVEKIGQAFKDIIDIFDETSFEGQQIKALFGDLGGELGDGMKGAVPLVREAVDQMVLAALKLELGFYEARAAMGGKELFNKKVFDEAKDDLEMIGGAIVDIAKGVEWVAKAWGKWHEEISAVTGAFATLIPGIGALKAAGAVSDLFKAAKGAVGGEKTEGTEKGGAGAPATVAGHAKGGEIRKPDKGEVFVSASPGETIVPRGMALVPRGGPGGGGTGRLEVNITHRLEGNVAGAPDLAAQVASQLTEKGFTEQLARAVRRIAISQGVPTQSQVPQ